jgi:hypothetical protein
VQGGGAAQGRLRRAVSAVGRESLRLFATALLLPVCVVDPLLDILRDSLVAVRRW